MRRFLFGLKGVAIERSIMNLTYLDLKKIVDDYNEGLMSKTELCTWSKKTYYDFLTAQFLNIEWIYMYPFVMRFSTICTMNDEKSDVFSCTDFEINKLINIIKGNINSLFTLRFTIPWEHKQMEKYKKLYYDYEIIKIKILKDLSEQNVTCLEGYGLFKRYNDISTIIDLIELKISNILYNVMDEGQHTCLIDLFYNSKNQYGTKKIIDILMRYIDCILGNRGIIVEISYYQGNPSINLYPDS